MGTFLKYLVYLLIIIALYIFGKGFYDGSINSSTTVGSVAAQVDEGTKNIARETADAVSHAVDEAKQTRQHQ